MRWFSVKSISVELGRGVVVVGTCIQSSEPMCGNMAFIVIGGGGGDSGRTGDRIGTSCVTCGNEGCPAQRIARIFGAERTG